MGFTAIKEVGVLIPDVVRKCRKREIFQRRKLVVGCHSPLAPAPDLGTKEPWDSTLRKEERGREEQRRRERREEEKRKEREERGRERGRTREGSRLRKWKRLQTKPRG